MKSYLKMFPTILIGNALLAFSVCAFVVPHNLMLGGCTGIALTLQQVIDLPLSVLSAILNTIFFFLGLFLLSKLVLWSKSSRTAKTVVKDASGAEIILNPGTTYIQIIPASKGVTIE